MKKIILSVAACLVLLSGCGSTPKTVEIDNVAVYEDYMATLTDAEYFTADDGGQMIRVYVEYTNNGADGLYILESFIVKAFQNDTELANRTDINDDEKSVTLIQEVKDGQTIVGSYVFELTDSGLVEVRLCTPTADEELLAMKEYSDD